MKTLKYLTICLVVCCLFSGITFGQICQNGIQLSIGGTIVRDGVPYDASVGVVGETIDYTVTVSINLNNCDVNDITGYIVLPDELTQVDLPAIPNLSASPGGQISEDFGNAIIASYVISAADFGSHGSGPNEVRAIGHVDGTAYPPSGIPDFVESNPEKTTTVVTPCVDITKETCGTSKVGDTVDYEITITNCSQDDNQLTRLSLTSVTDTLMDDAVVLAALVAGGCDELDYGEVCTFEVPYVVQGGDPDPLLNEITVNYDAFLASVALGPIDPVSDDAEVDLVNPALDCSVDCQEGVTRDTGAGPEQLFIVDVCNTGDVVLEVTHDVPGVGSPVTLQAGQCASDLVGGPVEVWVPITGGTNDCDCGLGGGGSATLTINARGTIPICDLPNEIPVDGPCVASDTCGTEPCPCPEWSVDKECVNTPYPLDGCEPLVDCDLGPGDDALYDITISNDTPVTADCPAIELYFTVDDPGVTLEDGTPLVNYLVGPILSGNSVTLRGKEMIPQDACLDGPFNECIPLDENIVSVVAFCADGSPIDDGIAKTDGATCCYRCEGEPEGCTPGFWKNSPGCWCDSYEETTLVSDVFTRLQSDPYDDLDDDDRKSNFNADDLADSIRYRGGSGLAGAVRNMLRHATAALLNGCSADVGYPLSDAAVIDLVNFALDSQDIGIIQDTHTLLADWNEDSPCPISSDNANEPCKRYDDVINGF